MDLAVSDFSKFRARPVEKKKHGVYRLAKVVPVIRMIFKYAYDSELIDKPLGPTRIGIALLTMNRQLLTQRSLKSPRRRPMMSRSPIIQKQ